MSIGKGVATMSMSDQPPEGEMVKLITTSNDSVSGLTSAEPGSWRNGSFHWSALDASQSDSTAFIDPGLAPYRQRATTTAQSTKAIRRYFTPEYSASPNASRREGRQDR